MIVSAPKGNCPGVIQHETLYNVEIGIATLGGEVQRVAREFLVAERRRERVRRVVNGVGPCICHLKRETTRSLLGDISLQCVIDRGCSIIEKLRMQEGVVVDRIEGQTASFQAEPQVV